MKYRDIAKQFAYDKGFKTAMTSEDGIIYGEKKPFAPGQLGKANEALAAVADSMANKWGIPSKRR